MATDCHLSEPRIQLEAREVPPRKTHTTESGRSGRVFATTLGASVDLESEDLRRLLVNAVYWAVGLEELIPERSRVDYVGDYRPTFFGFGAFQRGLCPADFEYAEPPE